MSLFLGGRCYDQAPWTDVLLELDWQWVNIVKAPKIKTIPDILIPVEVERLIGATKKIRYRVFILATYSM